jgi:phosphatidylglycerophosphate synthase
LSALAFTDVAAGQTGTAILVAAVLLADWLDGATARRYKATSGGQRADVLADRASEFLLFLADPSRLGRTLLALAAVNAGLLAAGRARGRHWAMPLRFVYLVALLATR